MKIKIISIILIILLVINFIFPISKVFADPIDDSDIIEFVDSDLKDQLVELADNNGDGEISENEINTINFLRLSKLYNTEIDLTGLEKAKNIVELEIHANIKSMIPISGLEKLITLRIYGEEREENSLISLEPLKDLEYLESITINNLNITNLSYIDQYASIESIANIDLSSNKISDISNCENILFNATNLEFFSIDKNPILDLGSLYEIRTQYSSLYINSINFDIIIDNISKDSEYIVNFPQSYFQLIEDPYNAGLYEESNYHFYAFDTLFKTFDLTDDYLSLDTSIVGYNNVHIYLSKRYYDADVILFNFNVSYNVSDSSGDFTENIEFEDEDLDYLIRNYYDLDSDGTITERELRNISLLTTEICKEQLNIEDLSGIELMKNLKSIDLSSQKISDITIINQLHELEVVNLTNNLITDISSIENSNVYYRNIILNENFIDFSESGENYQSYIEYLNNTKYEDEPIDLCFLQISSVIASQKLGSPAEFDNEVNFVDNKIKNKLISLNFDSNDDNILTRRELYEGSEKNLDLSDMSITNISGLEYLTNLEYLNLSNNNIANFEPISKLYNLHLLNLSNTGLTNLDCIPKFNTGIFNSIGYEMNLSDNSIEDISCIQNWKFITYSCDPATSLNNRYLKINLSHNHISEIDDILSLKTIKKLDLSFNLIESISILEDFDFCINDMENLFALGFTENELLYLLEQYNETMLDEFEGFVLAGNPIDQESEETQSIKELFIDNNIPLFLTLKGDINLDGRVTLFDAFVILKKVITGANLTEGEIDIMDYNGDEHVTLFDAFSFLKEAILG